MNLEELKTWITNSKLVSCDTEYDECGNHTGEFIYENNGKLWKIYSMNKHWSTVYTFTRGHIKDEYAPIEVKEVEVRTVEYELVNPHPVECPTKNCPKEKTCRHARPHKCDGKDDCFVSLFEQDKCLTCSEILDLKYPNQKVGHVISK